MRPDFSKPAALFGGSFDPVHEGHLQLASEVMKALPGTRLVLVPACQSPGKAPPAAPAALRLHWLEQVAAEEGFGIWATELERGGVSYTVETLEEAHRQGASRERLFLVLGADSYASLSRWKDSGRIRSLCRIVAVCRPGTELSREEADDILLSPPPHPASSSAIREGLAANPPRVKHLPPVILADLEKLILLSQNPYARK